jgi:curved DNA-binding protein CbpA
MGVMMWRMKSDPAGFYERLEVDPAAPHEAIAAAFRRKARVLHPDIPTTGDVEAFVRMKEAYDVLGDVRRRAAYDRAARAKLTSGPSEMQIVPPVTRGPRLSDLPVAVWAALGGLFCVAAIMAVFQLTRRPPPAPVVARPFAPSVPPAGGAQTATRAAVPAEGMATHYVLPAGGPTILWRRDAGRDAYHPGGELAAFTPIRALRLVPQHGLMEIRLSDGGSGFIDAARLAPGDQATAHRTYCSYNAGPSPANGEVLDRHGSGAAGLQIDNHGSQPVVVKLREVSGVTALSVYVVAGGSVMLTGLPSVRYRPEFAAGELWSRACHGFSAGMRAQRFADFAWPSALSPLVVPPAPNVGAQTEDISDAAFERE